MAQIQAFNNQYDMCDAYFDFIDELCSTYLIFQQSKDKQSFSGRGIVIPESQVSIALRKQKKTEPLITYTEYYNTLKNRMQISQSNPLIKIFEKCQATDFQQLLIFLAFALEINRKYERIFGYLQDNIAEKKPTIGLLVNMYSLIADVSEHELSILRNSDSPINKYIIAQSKNDISLFARPLSLRQSVVLYLSGTKALPDIALLCAKWYLPDEAALALSNEYILNQAVTFSTHIIKTNSKGLLQIIGQSGSGKRFTLHYISKTLSMPILVVDCNVLTSFSNADRRAALEAITSSCFFEGSAIALINMDCSKLIANDSKPIVNWLILECCHVSKLVISCSEQSLFFETPTDFLPLQLNLPAFSMGEQKKFWEARANELCLPISLDTDFLDLTGIFSLTPGQIKEALLLSKSTSIAQGKTEITQKEITQGIRLLCSPKLKKLAEPLDTHFDWDDLKLEDDAMNALRLLCSRLHNRYKVEDVWGFNQKLPYGRGISVLLYGPPGTGKTMAAQVLAKEFGLDAYRVDMSQIIDKYIGETEKKLSILFDAAKDSNAILFFDEADALFAKRTEVSDSKDKYANAETAYLLQRIEAHNGISIMATNIAQNFDEAFKRRISFMIHIAMPSQQIRRQLWQSVFPNTAPVNRQMLDFFADKFELSGSSIKNIAVSAAYLAASDGTEITRNCIAFALRREMLKSGRVILEHELY